MPPSGLDPRQQSVAKDDTTSAAGISDPIWRCHKSAQTPFGRNPNFLTAQADAQPANESNPNL